MKIIEQLLNVIFPPRPTQLLIQKAVQSNSKLARNGGQYESIHFLTRYEDALVAAAIRENKFFHNTNAAKLLGESLRASLSKYTNNVVIIPIPLSKERFREREHNQVETIARQTNTLVRADVLERIKNSAPQTSLNRAARLKNISGAFLCTKPDVVNRLEHSTIILLDDVVTTGATLKAARATLASHLHPTSTLICMAIAH